MTATATHSVGKGGRGKKSPPPPVTLKVHSEIAPGCCTIHRWGGACVEAGAMAAIVDAILYGGEGGGLDLVYAKGAHGFLYDDKVISFLFSFFFLPSLKK